MGRRKLLTKRDVKAIITPPVHVRSRAGLVLAIERWRDYQLLQVLFDR